VRYERGTGSEKSERSRYGGEQGKYLRKLKYKTPDTGKKLIEQGSSDRRDEVNAKQELPGIDL
jgi:hypothetical protein